MIPILATLRHAAPDDGSAVALALESPWPGIEASIDIHDVARSIRSAAGMGSFVTPVGQSDQPEGSLKPAGLLPIRYHYPLGALEISGPDPRLGEQTLASMTHAVAEIAAAGGDFLTVHAALPHEARESVRFAETADRLARLVVAGRSAGVTIALENLRWGLTSEPDAFLSLVELAGCAVTLDVGHAGSSDVADAGFSAERFVRACGGLVAHAHVYERESDHHHAPEDLSVIGPALEALLDVGCPWWTIELIEPAEVRSTRELLVDFLAAHRAGDRVSPQNVDA